MVLLLKHRELFRAGLVESVTDRLALGIELKKSYFRLGTDYHWETYPDWPGGGQQQTTLKYISRGTLTGTCQSR